MKLGEFRELTKNVPDEAEMQTQLYDYCNDEFFTVKADAALKTTQFYDGGKRLFAYEVVIFEEDSEEDGGGQ